MKAKTPQALSGEDHFFLLNRVSLDEYLSFMGSYPVDAVSMDRKKTAEEWRDAHEVMRQLRENEADWADEPAIHALPPVVEPLLKKVRTDPIFAKAYGDAPVEFGLVELDRLVVSQKLVCAEHLDRLQAQLGPQPQPDVLFRFCLPYDHPSTPFRAGRVNDDTFAFHSESSDLRFLDAILLKPEQISGYQAVGPVAGVIALVVGFGSNYLNVIEAEGRLLLNNGHHRACALRDMGLTHAPVVIQRAANAEELEALAPRAVRRNPDFYLSQPRPPVLKDYFDPRLCRHVRLAMSTKQVRIGYSVEELDMP
ncbi:MAG TPA: hypothetical protein VGZ47_19765 [Gemmataceae bacterium]|jgi:hypothetical protein|nr:hypothetical protein [Gemmataceae bacterium]